MVRATQKGEMASPSSEVSKAATSMSKSDVKKFAKTKHKGLPNKVEVEEGHKSCKAGYYYCYTDKKCKPIPKGFRVVGPAGMLRKENGHTVDDDSETKNGKKNGNGNGNGNGGNGSVSEGLFNRKPKYRPSKAVYGGAEAAEKKKKLDAAKKGLPPGKGFQGKYDQYGREYDTNTGKLKETTYYKSDPKYQKKVADDDKRHKKQDQRMKFGKFYDKAKEAKNRLRPGEVKRYDKNLKKWVSNKD